MSLGKVSVHTHLRHRSRKDLRWVVRDRHAVLIKVSTSRSNKSIFLLEIASAIDPKIGLEITDMKAPSARKIDVNRCVKDGSRPIRCSRTVGNNGSMKAKRSSSERTVLIDKCSISIMQ